MTTRPPSPATPPTETPGRVQVVATGSTSTSPLSSSPAAAGLASAAVLPTTATTTTTTTLNSHNNNNNSSSNHANNPTLTNTTTAQAAAAPFPFIPRSYQQASTTATTFGQRFKAAGLPLSFPRLYSGPLFAAPSVSVNHTHIVSSIGPITPPLTIDHSTSSPIPSCSTGGSDTSPPSSTALAAPGKSTTVIPKRQIYKVVHDKDYCMFRITLDNKRIGKIH
ncbi:hypothetical protein BDB00DRAFT_54530 [Zychaea mexicana]|uniref:uncharacterized protein n=1 Tax=Zychaea mexicana TaxID=64656 RepID=UPI0022FE5C20|nr:uncharacterized protein BDB00DRAFT_54530 [Zychaea mexicana]KAI9497114.1 hypothetical protein BDB00DRAFT_54530 [Zychaea mexicana]